MSFSLSLFSFNWLTRQSCDSVLTLNFIGHWLNGSLVRAALNKGSNDSTFIPSERRKEREREKAGIAYTVCWAAFHHKRHASHHGRRQKKDVREVLTTHPTFHVQRPPHHLIKLPAFRFFAYSHYSQFRVLTERKRVHVLSYELNRETWH